ncbi:hypothetical protein IKE87_02815 [Candidatus Saccharibacteria bacterium]|nr:hypothetical protein [Candidatus Saccharibacteria bacterium]
MKKQKSKKWVLVVVILLIVVGVGAGAFFGARAIYDAGVSEGRKIEAEEVAESVRTLGQAVQEKVEFQEKLSGVFHELPEMMNSEEIDKYIENLNTLKSQINNESVITFLDDFIAKWQEFKNIYSTKDNEGIAEAFNALKTNSLDIANNIKTVYDEAIRTTISNL